MKYRWNSLARISGLFCALFLIAGSTWAQQSATASSDVPRVMSYQAAISDAAGKPLTDGDYSIGAALYTNAGDHALWHDTFRVHAVAGVVNVLLGSGAVPLPDMSEAGAIQIGIRIEGGDELPRSRLTAAPYALTVPNGAITADKMGVDFVGSLSVNGQQLSSKGGAINIVTDGIDATVDPGTNTLILRNSGSSDGISLSKGEDAQTGTTVIGGNLQVTGSTELRGSGGLSMYGNQIHNAADPTSAQDGATKAYVDVHSGEVSNFVSVLSSCTPNATVPVVQLRACNAATDVDIALTPKGKGGLAAQVADNTTTGGNKRGTSAVDWQMGRTLNTEVASADFSIIAGGTENESDGATSTIGGGSGNLTDDPNTTIAGGDENEAAGDFSAIGGGQDNYTDLSYSVVAGGRNNASYGTRGTVGGGDNNETDGDYSVIAGGKNNYNDVSYSAVGGGDANATYGQYATIAGGRENEADGSSSTIGGGKLNSAENSYSTVSGGESNDASEDHAVIGGGQGNAASGSLSVIGGGFQNIADGDASTVGGGVLNIVSAPGATIPGGYGAAASNIGQMAYANGFFSVPGDAQTSLFVAANLTTDATPTMLSVHGIGENSNIAVPANGAMTFRVTIVAKTAGNTTPDVGGWTITGLIYDNGGVATIAGTNVTACMNTPAGWGVPTVGGDGSVGMAITVTGVAATNIQWVARVETTETVFAP